MYTLAVIDMQKYFLNRFKHFNKPTNGVLEGCKKEITKAIADKAKIVFVEYSSYGDTAEELVQITRDADYPVYYTIKTDDDGGVEIAETIKTQKLSKRKIRICGINTEYCIKSTVRGLLRAMKTSVIEVISDACGSPWDHEGGVEELEEMSENFPKLRVM